MSTIATLVKNIIFKVTNPFLQWRKATFVCRLCQGSVPSSHGAQNNKLRLLKSSSVTISSLSTLPDDIIAAFTDLCLRLCTWSIIRETRENMTITMLPCLPSLSSNTKIFQSQLVAREKHLFLRRGALYNPSAPFSKRRQGNQLSQVRTL